MRRIPSDVLLITLDVDWAPDFAIDYAADILAARGVRATWFVTHDSPASRRLRDRSKFFEVGIHPNFLPGSTHGSEPSQVLRHCMALVPAATSMRTHALMQSTPLLNLVLKSTSIRFDVSLYVPRLAHVAPVEHWWDGRRLLRIPYIWEDDLEMERPEPLWDVDRLSALPGLKILDFHPIHIYLNGHNREPYEALKRRFPVLPDAAEAAALDLKTRGPGPGQMFEQVIDLVSSRGGGWTVAQLFDTVRSAS